jgi:hypothetical protein
MNRSVLNGIAAFFLVLLIAGVGFVAWAILSGNSTTYHLPARPGTCPSHEVLARWSGSAASAVDPATGVVKFAQIHDVDEEVEQFLPSELQPAFESTEQAVVAFSGLTPAKPKGSPPLTAQQLAGSERAIAWMRTACPEEAASIAKTSNVFSH